jgi:hypothetical protein
MLLAVAVTIIVTVVSIVEKDVLERTVARKSHQCYAHSRKGVFESVPP